MISPRQEKPATVVNKLISRDGVVGILGEVASSRSLEAAPICQEAHIPMISPSSTNPKVTETGDYIFRVCFIDPFQGTVMANFATKTLEGQRSRCSPMSKVTTARQIWPNFSRKDSFRLTAADRGGTRPTTAATKISGMAELCTAIANPQIQMRFLFLDTTRTWRWICIQARQLGLNVPIFGGSA